MSHLLWASYVTDNVERFRRQLGLTVHSAPVAAGWNGGTGGGIGSTSIIPVSGSGYDTGMNGWTGFNDLFGDPNAATPKVSAGSGKTRKASGIGGGGAGNNGAFGKNEINSRDHAGLTILLRAASLNTRNALGFVQALLEHPATDIYVQDQENGWNALHRALYAGNISIARLLLERERRDIAGQTLGSSVGRVGRLIKTKDNEGNSPFDLYNTTINRHVGGEVAPEIDDMMLDSDGEEILVPNRSSISTGPQPVSGDDLFFFGSNKNLTLGMGDSDDRQYPERVHLKFPDDLLYRHYDEYLEDNPDYAETATRPTSVSELPQCIKLATAGFRDVVISKLHSAILTDDAVSNLYTCGVGRGGRLGLGDENTRFSFECVQGPFADKRVIKVALGQNHSMAITDNGQLWTWGSNTHSQLGYALPPSTKKDEDPMTSTPRQVFGPLKKETIIGIAASSHHSVAHTATSLYCWGKNVGQLALMDADSRSLDVQAVPRKVAASLFAANIVAVSAIDRATIVLLANHGVCVFTSYGYRIVKFDFTETIGHQGRWGKYNMASRYDPGRGQINQIASGGETIAAVTSRGDLFTTSLTNLPDASQSSSTTNPSKIRDSLTTPQCIWTARKDGVRSVGVGEQGSVIISTHSGAVWRRIKRAKAKDVQVSGQSSGRSRTDMKKKDYKFERVPFISNIKLVRSSAFGAFAAIRCDSDVFRKRTFVDGESLAEDLCRMAPLANFMDEEVKEQGEADLEEDHLRMYNGGLMWESQRVLRSTDLINDLARHLSRWKEAHRNKVSPPGVILCTSIHPEIRLPMYSWIVNARSPVLRRALLKCREGDGSFELPEVFSAKTEKHEDGYHEVVVTFPDLDMMSLLNIVFFMCDDEVLPVWNRASQGSSLANRYRTVRAEVMKIATRLEMPGLERAARVQTQVQPSMAADYAQAIRDPRFFDDADIILELDGAEVPVHRELMCQRSPWFYVLFYGRSKGQWLATRRQGMGPTDKLRLDFKHMSPKAFECVLDFLYTDSDTFIEQVVVPNSEAFFDYTIDVLSIANELMLHRLAQTCQRCLAASTTTRNVSHLLNAVSPCSVRNFKDAGLEYICEQMETMLENHVLDDLDEDLLEDLDKYVNRQQLLKMPYVKAGLAEHQLAQKYPGMTQDIVEERLVRVREMAYKATVQRGGGDDERRPSATGLAGKGRVGSLDDQSGAASPSASTRSRRKSRISKVEQSPLLRPKNSTADLMFSMEDDESPIVLVDRPKSRDNAQDGTAVDDGGPSSLRDATMSMSNSPAAPSTPLRRPGTTASSRGFVKFGLESTTPEPSSTPKTDPWGASASTPNSTSRLDLRSIMTETSTSPPFITKTSALSAGLDAQRAAAAEPVVMTPAPKIASTPKLSQRERKKQQLMQQQIQDQVKNTPKGPAWDTSSPGDGKRPSLSWQSPSGPSSVPGSSSQPSLTQPTSSTASPGPSSGVATPALAPTPKPKKPQHIPGAASPDTRFAGQSRPSPSSAATSSAPLIPHSKVYIKPAPKAEPVLGLTMADIFLQQQLELESAKEAVAKRSLQEIQEEQRFQEWWDQESRRAQEEEAQRQNKGKGREGGGGGGGSGSGSGGRKKKGKAPATGASASASTAAASTSTPMPATGNPEGPGPKKRKASSNGGRTRGGGNGGGGGGRNGSAPEAAAGGDGQSSRRRGGGGGNRGGKA